MNFPKKVRLGGCDIKINFVDKMNHDEVSLDTLGLWDEATQEISILKKYRGNPLSRQYTLKVLLHELIHAVDSIFNNFSLEEETVLIYTSGFFDFLTNNNINFFKNENIKFPKYLTIGGLKYSILTDNSIENNIIIDPFQCFAIASKSCTNYMKKKLIICLAMCCIEDDCNKELIDTQESSFPEGIIQLFTDVDFKKLLSEAIAEDTR